MTYNEYWQVVDGGLSPSELVVYKYEDQRVATLEDGLYVLEKNLSNSAFVNKMARFLRASIKGWEFAANNPDTAADIVLENDDTGAQTEKHQRRMMREINKLIVGFYSKGQGVGYLKPSDYERTVNVLLASDSDPVITKKPRGAWSHKIWNAM